MPLWPPETTVGQNVGRNASKGLAGNDIERRGWDSNPRYGYLSPDQSKLYVANGLTNDMTVIDVASLKAEKSVPVGRLPWGVAVVP